jgi:hypothetical protein
MTGMESAFNTELYEALNYLSSKADEATEKEAQRKMMETKQKARR